MILIEKRKMNKPVSKRIEEFVIPAKDFPTP